MVCLFVLLLLFIFNCFGSCIFIILKKKNSAEIYTLFSCTYTVVVIFPYACI